MKAHISKIKRGKGYICNASGGAGKVPGFGRTPLEAYNMARRLYSLREQSAARHDALFCGLTSYEPKAKSTSWLHLMTDWYRRGRQL